MIKIEAAQRLKVTAGPSNKLKNEVMRALTGKDLKVDRQGDTKFIAHGNKDTVIEALEGIGWKYDSSMREFLKSGEDYSILCSSSGSATSLEFIYDA